MHSTAELCAPAQGRIATQSAASLQVPREGAAVGPSARALLTHGQRRDGPRQQGRAGVVRGLTRLTGDRWLRHRDGLHPVIDCQPNQPAEDGERSCDGHQGTQIGALPSVPGSLPQSDTSGGARGTHGRSADRGEAVFSGSRAEIIVGRLSALGQVQRPGRADERMTGPAGEWHASEAHRTSGQRATAIIASRRSWP